MGDLKRIILIYWVNHKYIPKTVVKLPVILTNKKITELLGKVYILWSKRAKLHGVKNQLISSCEYINIGYCWLTNTADNSSP